MKTIQLQKLILKDFQGGNCTLLANGEDVNVFGDNATGKTRLASAWSWLLFDKDSLGRFDFEIKNTNAQGEAEHGLEHSVEAVLDVDGEQITLKKVYKEMWSKKRGSATATFTGNTTDYFIDGVPTQKKDYVARITDIAGDEVAFRLLTSPTVFPALHWEKQRALLLEVCGDINDANVIASDAKLAPLPSILAGRKLDDHRKVIAARRTEINKELTALPVRIDENRRALPDVTGLDLATITADIKILETEINAAKLKLQGVDTGGSIAFLTKQLAGINADIQKMESVHYSENMKAVNHLSQQLLEITQHLNSDRLRVSNIDGDLKRKTFNRDAISLQLADFRKQWSKIDSEIFQDTTLSICVSCNQPLPPERVQDARDKALATFNQHKAERLEEINARGLRLKDDQDNLQAEIDTLSKEREIVTASIPETEAKLQTIIAERDAVKRLAEDYTEIPGHADLIQKKEQCEAEIKAERDGRATDAVMIREAITVAQNKLTAQKEYADRFTRRETGEQRIEALKAQEKTLAAEYEKLESDLFLCEQFIKTKVALLTDRINSRFELARFKLFNQNINGGIEPCCEITVNGIPYNAGLNNAARINAGLDVCRTLSEYYGLQAPIFVDNAESVVNLIAMQTQVVRLVVSAGYWKDNPDGTKTWVPDDKLRVESARKAVAV